MVSPKFVEAVKERGADATHTHKMEGTISVRVCVKPPVLVKDREAEVWVVKEERAQCWQHFPVMEGAKGMACEWKPCSQSPW